MQRNHVTDLSHPTCVLILRNLQDGPGTYDEIANELKLSARTVKNWVYRMRDAGLVHVGGWERRGATQVPVIFLGGGEDKRKLRRIGNTKAAARYRERHPDRALAAVRAYRSTERGREIVNAGQRRRYRKRVMNDKLAHEARLVSGVRDAGDDREPGQQSAAGGADAGAGGSAPHQPMCRTADAAAS